MYVRLYVCVYVCITLGYIGQISQCMYVYILYVRNLDVSNANFIYLSMYVYMYDLFSGLVQSICKLSQPILRRIMKKRQK